MGESGKQALPVAAIVALQEGNLIQAIKLVREASGLGLKEAHDLVRDYIASHPELRERFAEAESKTKRAGCLMAIGLIAAVIAAIVVFRIYGQPHT